MNGDKIALVARPATWEIQRASVHACHTPDGPMCTYLEHIIVRETFKHVPWKRDAKSKCSIFCSYVTPRGATKGVIKMKIGLNFGSLAGGVQYGTRGKTEGCAMIRDCENEASSQR